MSDSSDSSVPASWKAENAEASSKDPKRLLLIVGAVVVVLAIAGAIALAMRGDAEETVWPPDLGGRAAGLGEVAVPASQVAVTAEPGVYLWSDFDGWHLWVVNGDGIGPITGSIEADDEVGDGNLAIEGAGTLTVDEQAFTFELPADPGLVGIDFNPGFFTEELTVVLEGPDGPVDPSLVRFGRSGESPDEVPFTLEKIPAPEPDE